MTTRTRLDKATKHFTPKQIVLLSLKEGHALGSALAYAKEVLRENPDDDLCAKIEASVLGDTKARSRWGARSGTEVESIREAQREGLFLWGLAMRCNEMVTEEREVLDLRWLLWSQTFLTFETLNRQAEGLGEAFAPLFTIAQVGRELRSVRDEVLALASAVG